jgi:Protein of unknown function, DUF599
VNEALAWAAAAVLLACELAVLRWPSGHAASVRATHARLRVEWFEALSQQPGSELLAVQTLRNALMSATVTASTAVLALMGWITLMLPAWRQMSLHSAANVWLIWLTPTLLLGALLSSSLAVRSIQHASYIASLPAGGPVRRAWADEGARHARAGGLHYGAGLRQLILAASAAIVPLHTGAALAAALGVALWLWFTDGRAVKRSVPKEVAL